MDRMRGHEDVEKLLGVYALDAVDPDEAAEIEGHLAICPRCRTELAEHREVAGLLGYAGGAAPEGLWDRIVASLEEPPPALRLARTPLDVRPDAPGPAAPSPPPAPVVSMAEGRRTVRMRVLVAVTAVAAVIVAGLGIAVARLEARTPRVPTAIGANIQKAWTTAEADPSARKVTLRSTDGTRNIQAVILPDGTSFLGRSNLPALGRDQTYQLWGVIGAVKVSLGVLGPAPTYQQFITPKSVSVLALTAERAPGVVTPTTVVAAGSVPTSA